MAWSGAAERDGREQGARGLFLGLVAATTAAALAGVLRGFAPGGVDAAEAGLAALLVPLVAWTSTGFWTAVLGFARCRRRTSASSPSSAADAAEDGDTDADPPRTVLVMPVCNESGPRVFAGLRATCESLLRTGRPEGFEVFILSDSSDPEALLDEEARWNALSRDLGPGLPVFYRNRPANHGHKAGNTADFCRRWGGRYRYMVVLDADSVMSGATLAELVRRMEADPSLGILQAPPAAFGRESLFGRIQQFACSVYGPLHAAGLRAWQGAEGSYWGHNAILRVAPFAAHCGLPVLPGTPPLGGQVMSHDSVEAALMRRAGFGVAVADDLEGSWEEVPPTLAHHLTRDRRWCQGNLQHARLLAARGLHPGSRLNLAMGVMAYLASPLWLCAILLAAVHAAREGGAGASAGVAGPALGAVAALVAVLLLGPKALALAQLLGDPRRRALHGGGMRAAAGVALEAVHAALLAPVQMLMHTVFIARVLAGRGRTRWGGQARADEATGLRDAVRAHGAQTALALAAGALALLRLPAFLPWVAPVLLGPALSIPLSMLTSRVGPGRLARRAGLFRIPAESDPPTELRRVDELLRAEARPAEGDGVEGALRDPERIALHLHLLGADSAFRADGAVADAPLAALGPAERRALLLDPAAVLRMHAALRGAAAGGGDAAP